MSVTVEGLEEAREAVQMVVRNGFINATGRVDFRGGEVVDAVGLPVALEDICHRPRRGVRVRCTGPWRGP